MEQNIDSLISELETVKEERIIELHQQLSEAYFLKGNYPKTLEYRLGILTIPEDKNDTILL